jgi:hypothetical protein
MWITWLVTNMGGCYMANEEQNLFDRIIWRPNDCMVLDDLVFRIMHHKSGRWSGGEHFMFYKLRELVEQYKDYFRSRTGFHPKNVMELGILDGGSIAFWHELFKPQKHIAVDLTDGGDSPYFSKYVESRGLSRKIKTIWSTDQADKPKLAALVKAEFDGPPDLIIDDASHLYEPTLASFEALFPLMAPGGLYIIEDWAWGHWRDFVAPAEWVGKVPLTQLVIELIEATGSWMHVIADIAVYQGFVSIERGPLRIDDPTKFCLEDYIYRRTKREALAPLTDTRQGVMSYVRRKLQILRPS